jgi:alpha-D-xyloside xylohydrolase
MPVFVRSGGVVPRVEVTPETRNTDDLVGQPWTVHVWGEVSQAAIDSLEGFDGPADIAEIIRHG